jgi:hypothetical protein
MMMCQDTKALFHHFRRLKALAVGMFKNQGGSEATKIWLAQVQHFMQGQQEPFQPIFSSTVSEAIKGPIREALMGQNSLDTKLTLRGYMSI